MYASPRFRSSKNPGRRLWPSSLQPKRTQFRPFLLLLLPWNLQGIGVGIGRVQSWQRSVTILPLPSNTLGMASPMRLSTMLALYASPYFLSSKSPGQHRRPISVSRRIPGRRSTLTSSQTRLLQSTSGLSLLPKRIQFRLFLLLLRWNLQGIGVGIGRVRSWPRSGTILPLPSNTLGMASPMRLSTILAPFLAPSFGIAASCSAVSLCRCPL